MASTKKNTAPRLLSAHDWHIHLVHNDPDFSAEVQSIKKRLESSEIDHKRYLKERQYLSSRWMISLAELGMYEVGRIIPLDHTASNAKFSMDLEKSAFSITFNPLATRAEILEEWSKFEVIRAELFPVQPSRRRAPDDPSLIFAIFKSRLHGTTFPDIYRLYSNGTLPGYEDGPTNQFADSRSLERYYNRYKP